jgi:hypothetical protein
MSGAVGVEGLLAGALAPVEPPGDLPARLRSAPASIGHAAAGERDARQLRTMRGPHRLARRALVAVAGAGPLALRIQRRGRPGNPRRDGRASAPR